VKKKKGRILVGKAGIRDARPAAGVRTLVAMDQQKLRAKAAADCSREMARLEKAKAELLRFESEDRDLFVKWKAATFGPMLTKLREVSAQISEKTTLIDDVEEEMFWTGERSPRAAYERVQMRKTNPDLEPAEEEADEGTGTSAPSPEAEEFVKELEEMQRAFFDEFLRTVAGVNPRKIPKDEYERQFAEFCGAEQGPPPPHAAGARGQRPQPGRTDAARIKEIYRVLVRRLHPDMRDKDAPDVSALWHEVQEAYADGNLERLETLMGMADMRFNTTGDHTSVSQMLAILKDLRRSFNGVQRNLRLAMQDLSWNFSKLADRSKLKERIRRELDMELARSTEKLGALETKIAKWTAPKGKSKKGKARTVSEHPELW
jgi:hypothetical protein